MEHGTSVYFLLDNQNNDAMPFAAEPIPLAIAPNDPGFWSMDEMMDDDTGIRFTNTSPTENVTSLMIRVLLSLFS